MTQQTRTNLQTTINTNWANNTSGAITPTLSRAIAGNLNDSCFNLLTDTVDTVLPSQTGNSGKFLTTNGTVSSWGSPAGSGNVTGPGSSTNTAIAVYSGTGGTTLLNTGVFIDGSNNVTGVATLASGAQTITSTSASSFIVGPNGATNPILKIDGSTASSATGLSLTGKAAAAGVTLQVLTSGTNETLNIAAAGNGNINLLSSGSSKLAVSSVGVTILNLATTSTASTARFSYTGAADTSLTAATEATSVYFNIGQTRQHASNTTIATQRDSRITGSTHSFVTSGGTITNSAVLGLDAIGQAGTNATITNASGLYIPAVAVAGTVTNAYGINVSAPTGGGTLNQAALFIGDVGHTSGDILINTAGKGLQVKGGSNARIGTGTLVGGTVTVSNTSVTANTLVFLQDTSSSVVNVGALTVIISAGVSFTVTSSNALDVSTFNYILIEKN